MTIYSWLTEAIQHLKDNDISTAQLDAEVLLADKLNVDRSWLHAHTEDVLTTTQLSQLKKQISRRKQHEPLAYIRGKQEFYGRTFRVSPDTLSPRPETETLVSIAVDLIANDTAVTSVADIGTGSGCIAITIDKESARQLEIVGYEISAAAIKIARGNVSSMQSSVLIQQNDITSDAVQPWADSHLIVANLPYVPTGFHINTAATHEPDIAIFGGSDGLDYYRTLFEKLRSADYVITESLPPQHEELRNIAEKSGYLLQRTTDLIQVFKKD